jgi:hypothetical protein
MPDDRNQLDSLEIEPLSDEELEGVAGGNETEVGLPGDGGTTSSGPSCCSCSNCSN